MGGKGLAVHIGHNQHLHALAGIIGHALPQTGKSQHPQRHGENRYVRIAVKQGDAAVRRYRVNAQADIDRVHPPRASRNAPARRYVDDEGVLDRIGEARPVDVRTLARFRRRRAGRRLRSRATCGSGDCKASRRNFVRRRLAQDELDVARRHIAVMDDVDRHEIAGPVGRDGIPKLARARYRVAVDGGNDVAGDEMSRGGGAT